MSTATTRHPRALGLQVARELVAWLRPLCEPDRLLIAGSLRRRCSTIGDVEVLYIARREIQPDPADLFAEREVDLADQAIADLVERGVLDRRPSIDGRTTYGPQNKLLVHRETGLPVDLFAATDRNWWNLVVCRTGSAANNQRLATRARELGYIWTPYGSGFSCLADGRVTAVRSERGVYEFLKLPYLEPQQR